MRTNKFNIKGDKMKKRWFIYAIVGIVFGVFDFYYQRVIQGLNLSGMYTIILCYGIWLVPLLPIALYESKVSLSSRKASIASVLTWSASIISYYMFLAIELMFIGRESRIEMHISNYADPYFWSNWKSVFYGQVVAGIIEWIVVAIVGGFIIGYLVNFTYIKLKMKKTLTTDDETLKEDNIIGKV